jgi:hypothetical protein
MRDFSPVYDLPNVPAVYAFYSGGRGPQYAAYVGIAGRLKQRIIQHLIRRDSSVATGTSAVNLNPDQVTSLSWWEHADFKHTVNLKAAEMVAFEILNPALRSRGTTDKAGSQLLKEEDYYSKMQVLFQGNPTGSVAFVTLTDPMNILTDYNLIFPQLPEEDESLQEILKQGGVKKESAVVLAKAFNLIKDINETKATTERIGWLNLWSKAVVAMKSAISSFETNSDFSLQTISRATFEWFLHALIIAEPIFDQYKNQSQNNKIHISKYAHRETVKRLRAYTAWCLWCDLLHNKDLIRRKALTEIWNPEPAKQILENKENLKFHEKDRKR